MPTLIRLVVVLGVLAALVYAGVFYLANGVRIAPHEISEAVELPKTPR